MKRRRFLTVCGTGLFWPGSTLPLRAQEESEPHPLASFDREVERYMESRGTPGGALAVVKDRRLVYARGFGWADRERQVPVPADSLFRIASVSKPITAVAVIKLAEEQRLNLDDRALDRIHFEPLLAAGKSSTNG